MTGINLMKRSLFMGTLTIALVGCAATLPANVSYDNTPDYEYVVSDPLDGLLPPPKVSDLVLPVGSKSTNEIKQHLESLNEYRRYIERSIDSVKELIEQTNRIEIIEMDSSTLNCSIGLIENIPTDDAPKTEPLPETATEEEIALAAVLYAKRLEAYQTSLLKTVNKWVDDYNYICGKH